VDSKKFAEHGRHTGVTGFDFDNEVRQRMNFTITAKVINVNFAPLRMVA